MEQSRRETIKDIVGVIYRSNGEWRTPGGIARDLGISFETVSQTVKNHPEFFILASDGRAKFALRLGGYDGVSLTERARELFHRELTLSS